MVRVSIATLAAAALVSGAPAAMGQTAPDRQAEIHCFVSGCDEAQAAPTTQPNADSNAASDPCMDTGVCPAGPTKGFHLSGAAPTRPVGTRPNAPASNGQGYVQTGKANRPGRRSISQPSSERHSLDMRLSFEKGSSELTPDARQQADIFARELIAASGNRQFVIEGHTDNKGSAALNRTLSRQRAQSVVEYLVGKGVPRTKLVAKGFGFDRPRPGTTAADPSNRRVEIVRY
jgi:outer membrane protein OmpA-like peptidoglycan-associated protein